MPNTFSHDSNARNDEKLIRLRMRYKSAGYGVYFMLLEIMRENKDFACYRDYNAIAFELREDSALIKAVVEDFGLFVFTDDGKYFYSENFRRRMEKEAKPTRKRKPEARNDGSADLRNHGITELGNDGSTELRNEVRVNTTYQRGDYIKELKRSDEWIEHLCMNHHLKRDDIMAYLDRFSIDCQCNERLHLNETDAKRHFNAWLKIQLVKDSTNGTDRYNKSKTASFGAEEYSTSF